MKDTDPDRRDELTDAQLDQMLAETNRELLEHVEATSDPNRTLNTIMGRNAKQARRDARRDINGLGEALIATAAAAVTISDRIRAFASTDRAAWRVLICVAGAATSSLFALGFGGLASWPPIVTVAVTTLGLVIAGVMLGAGIGAWRRLGRDPGQALTAIMRSRMDALALARDLTEPANGLTRVNRRALNTPHARARRLARDRAVALDRLFAKTLAHQLVMAIDLARERDRAIARGRARDQARAADLDRELRRLLADVRAGARVLARALDERQVDVSGADLSGMNINPELLNGAIWTDQTSWPPGVFSQVKAHSTEIRPDVYQVRLGNTLERGFLTLS